jgi:hypothetical protein
MRTRLEATLRQTTLADLTNAVRADTDSTRKPSPLPTARRLPSAELAAIAGSNESPVALPVPAKSPLPILAEGLWDRTPLIGPRRPPTPAPVAH